MSKCAFDDPHDWKFMFTRGNTKTLIEAIWGCHCGVVKKVDMRWQFSELDPAHPDNRYAAQRALEDKD